MSDRGLEAARDDFDSICWSCSWRPGTGAIPLPMPGRVLPGLLLPALRHDLSQVFFATVLADGFSTNCRPRRGSSGHTCSLVAAIT